MAVGLVDVLAMLAYVLAGYGVWLMGRRRGWRDAYQQPHGYVALPGYLVAWPLFALAGLLNDLDDIDRRAQNKRSRRGT